MKLYNCVVFKEDLCTVLGMGICPIKVKANVLYYITQMNSTISRTVLLNQARNKMTET